MAMFYDICVLIRKACKTVQDRRQTEIMADRMTREQRHICMSHIRGKDTRPELVVRKSLFAAGFRYRLNVRSLPGSPDIVLKKWHTVIFVNGCFWHGHRGCRLFSLPQTNRRFWEDKIDRNIRRDAAVQARLMALGWKIIVIWECELDPARHYAEDGHSRVSRRDITLATLPQRIMDCAAAYENERKTRLEIRKEAKEQRLASECRRRLLAREIKERYHIPGRIVTEPQQETGQESYEPVG